MIELDPETFRERFNKRCFVLRHALAAHPLFELPRLIELARDTAAQRRDDLYYDAGVTDVNERWGKSPCRFPIDETLHRIESAGAFIILKRADTDPAYRDLLERCMSDLLEVSGRELEKRMRRKEAIIFITSPRRISTYHIDSETNFLLQVRGEKDISIFNKYDREVLPEEEIERFWVADRNAAVYKPQLQHRAEVIRLVPGNGVHIPVNCPHWVQNDDNISVSVSINYHSWDRDYAHLYCANYYLRRKLGIRPTPPWRSPLLDAVKRPVGALLLRYKDTRYGAVRKP